MGVNEIWEKERDQDLLDPDMSISTNREVVTQNYDLVVSSLMDQIKDGDIVIQPSFQRGYIWPNKTASRLIESIVLNVPIPPCYLSQNDDYELDVIDGQQRLQSIFRYMNNQFALSALNIATELNGKKFDKLPTKIQRQIKTHTIRCVVITNKSHTDVKFDIFERLNANTSSLNAQELRNCVYRGPFNELLREIASRSTWLAVLGRKSPDKRMRGEEMVLRYFAFRNLGLGSYRTPLKNWLNDTAKHDKNANELRIQELDAAWNHMISIATIWFKPSECFRRINSRAINKSLFDLVSQAANDISIEEAKKNRERFRRTYFDLIQNTEFEELITRAVDHKKRTERRFEMWKEKFSWLSN